MPLAPFVACPHLPPLWSAIDQAEYDAARARRPAVRARPRSPRPHAARLGRVAAGLGLVALSGWALASATHDPAAALAASTSRRDMVCAESGEVICGVHVRAGDPVPAAHPATGRPTLYPAELCFWTAEGLAKTDPTRVLLNEHAGRPGPTVCPDCGREVVHGNPMPPLELMLDAARR